MKTVASIFILSVGLTAQLWAQAPLSFKIAANSRDGVILLVPASTTDVELTKLLNDLHAARKNGTLGNFFPPTTPGGNRGPYGVIQVFVMSDAAWATALRLKSYMNPTVTSETEKEFAKRVRAYYLYPLGGQEFGSIGYEDEDIRYKAPNYKKLF